jgi:membrane dipeptidase
MYIDLHADSLTASLSCGGLGNFNGHISLRKLVKSGCVAQCFAIFSNGDNAQKTYNKALQNYNDALKNYPNILYRAQSHGDILGDILKGEGGKCAAILTVENLGFISGDLSKIPLIKAQGVRIASLVWNTPNLFAYPNVKAGEGTYREKRGLKKLGREAVSALVQNKIIVDVSHLSDGGFYDVASVSTLPFVASHSNCNGVCNVSRNLSDEQIKILSDRGGVMGINFSKNFLGGGGFSAVLAHVKYAIKIGGEDVVAIGSDFDGTTTPRSLNGCDKVANLLNYLNLKGVSARVCDKFAYKNVLRIFKEFDV